ncbi:unnamed protein product, partial [Didymodactylos carnosus]
LSSSSLSLLNGEKQAGRCGLKNEGSICYMNSALQCLSNIPQLTDYFLKWINNSNKNIANVYADLIKTMWSSQQRTLSPKNLMLTVSDHVPEFFNYRQQDAQEFMNILLDLLHSDLQTKDNGATTIIEQLFHWKIQSAVSYESCNKEDVTTDSVTFLPF